MQHQAFAHAEAAFIHRRLLGIEEDEAIAVISPSRREKRRELPRRAQRTAA
jgi:hypothetical protein